MFFPVSPPSSRNLVLSDSIFLSFLPPFLSSFIHFPTDASEDIPDQGRRPRAYRFILFQVTSSCTYRDISSDIRYHKSNYNPSHSPFRVPLSTSSFLTLLLPLLYFPLYLILSSSPSSLLLLLFPPYFPFSSISPENPTDYSLILSYNNQTIYVLLS